MGGPRAAAVARHEDRTITFRYLDLLDEVQEEDILTGRDSVTAVFDRVNARKSEEYQQKLLEQHRNLAPAPAWASSLSSSFRLLNTPAQLAREGLEMKHCVGTYVSAVESGQCAILSVGTRYGRSTVELSRELEVRQHRAENNSEPHPRHVRLVAALQKRLRGGDV